MNIDREAFMKRLIEKGKESPDFKHQYEELAYEMSEKFGRQMYFVFWKYSEAKIREAFRICKENSTYKVAYLVGIINKL